MKYLLLVRGKHIINLLQRNFVGHFGGPIQLKL